MLCDDDDATGDAVVRVWNIEKALGALPADAASDPEYAMALALCHKRSLVAEDGYALEGLWPECRLVDAILKGSRFDAVPLLWHIHGKVRDERPTDAEFHAAWGER